MGTAGSAAAVSVVVARVCPSGSPSQCAGSITQVPRRVARGWVASQPPPSTARAWMADPVAVGSGSTRSWTRCPGRTSRAGTE